VNSQTVTRLPLLVLLIATCLGTASGEDSKANVQLSPESVVKQYCQKDFEGARTKGETYSQVEHLFLWYAEPGWDSLTVVKSYRILSSHVQGKHAVVRVEYETLGDIAGWDFKEVHKPVQVEFKLELGSKEWIWKSDEPVLVKSNMAWRITAPVIQPHISPPYAIKHITWLVQTQNDPKHQLENVLARLRVIR